MNVAQIPAGTKVYSLLALACNTNRQEFTFANADKSMTVTVWATSPEQAREIVRGVKHLALQGVLV